MGMSLDIQIPTGEKEPNGLPGQWFPTSFPLASVVVSNPQPLLSNAFFVPSLVAREDCVELIHQMGRSGQEAPVGKHGYGGAGGDIGSVRATGWSVALAEGLWSRFQVFFTQERVMTKYTATDWFCLGARKEHLRWKAVGVSPLLRFMRYESGGEHYGHYDMGFDYGDGRRTLVSFVLYLNDVAETAGGTTRFLDDEQGTVPVSKRNFSDWSVRAEEDQVLVEVLPQCGGVLFFDHRMCHDVAPYVGRESRFIVRGDIVFFAVEKD
jgi:hypothetical protein